MAAGDGVSNSHTLTANNKSMKQKIITLKISKATHGQLLTLAGELRIMARAWKRFGPDIEAQAGKLRELKHHQKTDIKKW